MADVEFEDADRYGASLGGRSRSFVNIAGALTSLALILGMGFWAYKLAVRDVTGVPVVRAMEGPMRVTPNDPGGVIAAHQGLSVNSVAAEGSAAALSDRLVLAPRPVDLTEEDAPGTMVALAAPVSGRSAMAPGLGLSPLEAPDADEDADALIAAALVQDQRDIDIEALVNAVAEGAVPLSGSTEGLDITLGASVSLPKGAIARSIRPEPRPGNQVQTGVAEKVALAVTTEDDGSALKPGTRLVQLGAFDSADVARSEWEKLSVKFGGMMGDKSRIIQSAQSGGRTFYRLRAMGFADEADSRRFCAALLAERAACIPVSVR